MEHRCRQHKTVDFSLLTETLPPQVLERLRLVQCQLFASNEDHVLATILPRTRPMDFDRQLPPSEATEAISLR